MPILSAQELQNQLETDLPGVLAPPYQPAQAEQDEAEKPAPKGKHAKSSKGACSLVLTNTNDTVIVAERLTEVATYLRDAVGYTYLSDIAVVDYLDDGLFELVYRFYHPEGGDSLVVKVRVPRDMPEVPSLTPIWPGANFHEREGFDLFGINFTGHPNLKRLYMWDEFEGHPMRKDFFRQGDKYLPD